MRITFTVTAIAALESHISVKAIGCNNASLLRSGMEGMVIIGNKKLWGSVVSVTDRMSKVSISLKFDRDLGTLSAFFPFQYVANELVMLMAEVVDAGTKQEAEKLLYALSYKTDKPIKDLLSEFTSFKPGIDARDDIRLVSEKQMQVIIDKARRKLEGAPEVMQLVRS